MLSRKIVMLDEKKIVKNGLIGYWNFLQGVNGSTWENIAPATKGSYNGVINGVSLQSDGFYFDGVDDYVSMGAFPLLNGLTSYTIQILLTPPETTLLMAAITLYNSISDFAFLGFLNSQSQYRYNYGNSYNLNSPYNFDSEGLLTIVVNGNSRKFFKGTTLLISDNISNSLRSFNNLLLGARGDISSRTLFYKGKIRAARIYDRALTDLEIAQNNDAGLVVGL